MKKRVTLQAVYMVFLCVHMVLLVIGGFAVKENRFELREEGSCVVWEPDSYEILEDGTQRYIFANKSDGMDDSLLFYTNHQEVQVYAEQELIYSRGKADTIFGHTSGAVWNMVEFPANTKEIAVIIKAIYRSGAGNEHVFYMGNGVGILRQMVEDSVFAMGVSVLLVIIGVCMIIYWLFLCRRTNVARELFYIGISAVLIGTWAFTEEKPVMLLFDNRVYASYITYVLLMLIGVTFILFVKHYIARKGRYFHKVLAVFAIGGMSLMMVLQALDIADFKETVMIVHIVLVGDLLYFLSGILGKMRCGRSGRHVGLNTVGLLILVLAVGVELFAYYTQIAGMQIFGMFGLLAYIMILGLETASDAAEKIAEIRKAEIYKELAEKDMLTKCYNRNAYSEDIKEILSKGTLSQGASSREKISERANSGNVFPGRKDAENNVYVVMFDLNDLKKCNDTLGHMEGDRYLTDAADLIKGVFEARGRGYRIGGDEFCVIMQDSSEEEIDGFIQKLLHEEALYNQESQGVRMQIAIGYTKYDAQRDADLDKTRSRADQLMYENKKQLKEATCGQIGEDSATLERY